MPFLALALLLLAAPSFADPASSELASSELASLSARVPSFRVVDLPATGAVTLKPEQSLTIESLRGVPLDDRPPVLGKPPAFPENMTNDCQPGKEPYIARDIAPFRFRQFDLEFNYGGWHNWAMIDYASAHGFNIISPYNRAPAKWTELPAGTKHLSWGNFVDWDKWMPEHKIPAGRYDKLTDIDVAAKLFAAHALKRNPGFDLLMIDMEHGVLNPNALRQQPWYPKDAAPAARQAFERKYYTGYGLTFLAPLQAARKEGWKSVGVYGWQPFPRQWWGLEKATADPATDWAWNGFGKAIYEAADVLYPDVYCFYWSPQDIAYQLTNLDFCRKLTASTGKQKPMRPYYWTLLHGGDATKHWWTNQPLATEEARAMTAFCFFTGCDGLVQWNWSDVGSHQVAPEAKYDTDVMVGKRFEAQARDTDPDKVKPTVFERYDMLHIVQVRGNGTTFFQPIEKTNYKDYGLAPGKPSYELPFSSAPYLRAPAEPISGVIEGLALVKPLEYILRHAEVKVDIPAQEQFAKTLPIVRRMKLGTLNVIATYDPQVVFGSPPRDIVLTDFDGHKGLTLTLPADAQTRLFVLRSQ